MLAIDDMAANKGLKNGRKPQVSVLFFSASNINKIMFYFNK